MANALQSITGLPSGVVRFVREAREELKKVPWPTRQQTIRYTIIVVISCLLAAAFIGGIDYLLALGLQRLILK